jgi:hypothetical protein
MARLVTRGFVRAIEPGPLRRGRLYHVHHKPLYEAIGQADNRNRRLCTIGRMVERVMVLDAVLGDRRCWWLGPECDKRAFFDVTQGTGLSPEGPRQRNHPDFPLRGFVRCDVCGRPLTGSWSKGRNGHYAYYHCQRQCRAVNVSKAALEGAFVDDLALLQPTPGYMRLVKDRILHVWEQRRAEASDRTTEQRRRVSAIQQKMDKLDEAFLYSEAIDVTTYGRQRDKLREELTLAKIDHHAEAVDELT